jgi:predicted dinucleotide-binding enzyme
MMDAKLERLKTKSEIDLWVVGAGVLGEEVARKFQKNFPVSAIVCETSSTRKHERFEASGFVAKLRGQRSSDDFGVAKNLVISIPPSSSNDYVSEVRDALQLWAGPSSGGSVVFTSSVGVYGEADGITVNEESPVDRVSPRSSL